MSYILDALQRAQAERGRGEVPGLHTPPPPALRAQAAPSAPARLAWLAAALLVGAGLTGAAWWLWPRPPAPAALAPQAPVPAPVSAAPPAPVEPAAVSRAPAERPGASRPVEKPVENRAEKTAGKPAQKPTEKAADKAADRPTRKPVEKAAAAPERRPAAPPAAAPGRPATPESNASAPVFAQADLPPAVRDQLPRLQLAGVTYSSNPLYRMVIVNGQVLHEGDQAAPGLVLERIEPGRTVWAFRGYRYALPSQ